jgi:tetratricopeptide (TPR) repeat protein
MTLEVTYNSLLIAQRKELHRQVGEAIEAQFPDRLEELAATLAYHFEKAASHDKAFDYLVRAASRAASVYALQEAIAYYQQALAEPSEKSPARLAPAHTGLGDVYYLVGKYQLALGHYELALRLVQDLYPRVALHRKMGEACEKWGKYDRAVTCFDAGLREMQGMMDAAEAARIYTGLGLVYYRRGELDAALELSALALDLMERLGDEWGIAQACNNLGIVYGGRGEWAQAIAFHQRCLSIWEKIGEAYGLAASHNNLGLIYRHQGEKTQAIEHYQQSLQLFEKIGNRHGLAHACDSLSQVYMSQGEKEKAMDYLMKAVAILAEIGMEKSKIVPEMWQSGAW